MRIDQAGRVLMRSSHSRAHPLHVRVVGPLLVSCILACLPGCGSDSVPIEGTVTLDGQPLAGVQILFDQPDVPSGNSFTGRTDQQGRFTLRPVSEPLNEPVWGSYRVTLTTAVADRDALEHTPLPREQIPRTYRGGTLRFDVPRGGSDQANFALQSR